MNLQNPLVFHLGHVWISLSVEAFIGEKIFEFLQKAGFKLCEG